MLRTHEKSGFKYGNKKDLKKEDGKILQIERIKFRLGFERFLWEALPAAAVKEESELKHTKTALLELCETITKAINYRNEDDTPYIAREDMIRKATSIACDWLY